MTQLEIGQIRQQYLTNSINAKSIRDNRALNAKQLVIGYIAGVTAADRALNMYSVYVPEVNSILPSVPRMSSFSRANGVGEIDWTYNPGDIVQILFQGNNYSHPVILGLAQFFPGNSERFKEGEYGADITDSVQGGSFQETPNPQQWANAGYNGYLRVSPLLIDGEQKPGNMTMQDIAGGDLSVYTGVKIKSLTQNEVVHSSGPYMDVSTALSKRNQQVIAASRYLLEQSKQSYYIAVGGEFVKQGSMPVVEARGAAVLNVDVVSFIFENLQKNNNISQDQYKFIQSAVLPCLKELTGKWSLAAQSFLSCNLGLVELGGTFPPLADLSSKLSYKTPVWLSLPAMLVPALFDLGCRANASAKIAFQTKFSLMVCCGEGISFNFATRLDVNANAHTGGAAIPLRTQGNIIAAGQERSKPLSQDELNDTRTSPLESAINESDTLALDLSTTFIRPRAFALAAHRLNNTTPASNSLYALASYLNTLGIKNSPAIVNSLDNLIKTNSFYSFLDVLSSSLEDPALRLSFSLASAYFGADTERVTERFRELLQKPSAKRCPPISPAVLSIVNTAFKATDLIETKELYSKAASIFIKDDLMFGVTPDFDDWLIEPSLIVDWLSEVQALDNKPVLKSVEYLIEGDIEKFLHETIYEHVGVDLQLFSREFKEVTLHIRRAFTLPVFGFNDSGRLRQVVYLPEEFDASEPLTPPLT